MKIKETWILLKQKEYYEPIYICKKDKNENMKYEKLFKKTNKNVNYVFRKHKNKNITILHTKKRVY